MCALVYTIYVDLRQQTNCERFVYIRSWAFFCFLPMLTIAVPNTVGTCTDSHDPLLLACFLTHFYLEFPFEVGVCQGQFFSMIVSVVNSVHERC
jgi:hypothetical protein